MATRTDHLESLVEYVTADGRVCPQPQDWNRLWEMLPHKRRDGAGWSPSLPLILAAWWEASDAEKSARLKLHLEYAAENGALGAVDRFLRDLPASGWHTRQNG